MQYLLLLNFDIFKERLSLGWMKEWLIKVNMH